MSVTGKSLAIPKAIAKVAKELGLEFEYVDARGNYNYNCPVCGSHDNLGLIIKEDRVVGHCHCGAGLKQVRESLGKPIPARSKPRKTRVRSTGTSAGVVVATYNYRDADGIVRFRKVRYEPKDFRIEYRFELAIKRGMKPTGEIREFWAKKKPRTPYQYYIYNYPEVLAARSRGDLVFLVDGEKDADTLTQAGLVGTCSPFGNGTDRNPELPNLQPWAREQLRGADIVIVVDRDENGKGYRAAWKQVRELSGQVVCFLEATHGKDTTDHYAAGGTVHTMRRIPVKEVRERAGA